MAVASEKGAGFGEVGDGWAWGFAGQEGGIGGAALAAHGAEEAIGASTAAERGTQFHDGGIPQGGIFSVGGLELGGAFAQPGFSGGGIDGIAVVKPAGEDAGDIPVHDGSREIECEGKDGAGGVFADSREAAQGGEVGGERAAVLGVEGLGEAVEIARPGVISEPLPEREDRLFGCVGKGGDIGKGLHPAHVVGDDGSDLGLLEHEFRDGDRVGIAGAPPGQVAPFAGEPGKEIAAQGGFLHTREHDLIGRVRQTQTTEHLHGSSERQAGCAAAGGA